MVKTIRAEYAVARSTWFWALGLALALPFVTGCWGMRRGMASIPYLSDKPPRQFFDIPKSDLFGLRHLDLPQMQVYIGLFDEMVTSDVAAILYVVPVLIRLRNEFAYDPSEIRVGLDFKATGVSRNFDPSRVLLHVDGRTVHPSRMDQPPLELEPNRRRGLTLIFDHPMPKPGTEIRLDLAPAFSPPLAPAIPAIRFKRIRWYTTYA